MHCFLFVNIHRKFILLSTIKIYNNKKLLLDPQDGEAAGSADLRRALQSKKELMKTPFRSIGGTLGHFESDVLSFIYCCRMSSNCDTYFKYRPSRDNSGYLPTKYDSSKTDAELA